MRAATRRGACATDGTLPSKPDHAAHQQPAHAFIRLNHPPPLHQPCTVPPSAPTNSLADCILDANFRASSRFKSFMLQLAAAAAAAAVSINFAAALLQRTLPGFVAANWHARAL